MLKAAVYAGADAVYLGLNRFNARSKADNFADEFFLSAIKYCHLRGVKVYVTFNTLIKESEFDEASRSVDFVVKNGADGIIVQDVGVMKYIAEKYPDFPLHVSTQAGICTLEGARFMQKLGAKRVVLARETSLEEVKRIKTKSDVEIEYFVQGALCVGYSGNCYMSSIIDGNSGNRGRCAQVCRKRAELIVGDSAIAGYNLSTCDTMLLYKVEELEKAGIDSFKIEGRMRSPEYVYYAVKAYKAAMQGEAVPEDVLNGLKVSFNRGEYSSAYTESRRSKVIYNKANSNIGMKIGKVSRVDGKRVIVKSSYVPAVGDGFKILRNGIEVGGGKYLKTDSCKNGSFTLAVPNICVGDEVRLNYSEFSHSFANNLDKKVDISVKYCVTADCVTIKCSLNGFEFEYVSDILPDKARSLPLDSIEFEKQFCKTADTDFIVSDISGEIEDGLFFPKSSINAIRRSFIEKLTNEYLSAVTPKYVVKDSVISSAMRDYTVKSCVITNGESDFPLSADAIVIRPRIYGKLLDSEDSYFGKYLYVPAFLDNSDIKLLDKIISQCGFSGVYADGLNAVAYAEERKLPYIVGVNCNVTNYRALQAFGNAVGFVNSKELNKKELLYGGMVLSGGAFVNMTLVHCPLINAGICDCSCCKYCDGKLKYRDDDGREFSVFRNKIAGCTFSLLNNKRVSIECVTDYLRDLSFESSDKEKEPSYDGSNRGHYNKGIV